MPPSRTHTDPYTLKTKGFRRCDVCRRSLPNDRFAVTRMRTDRKDIQRDALCNLCRAVRDLKADQPQKSTTHSCAHCRQPILDNQSRGNDGSGWKHVECPR